MTSRPELPAELPSDLAACHALIRAQAETIAELRSVIERLTSDMALLKRSLFGSRRERYVEDERQQLLFAPAETIETTGDQPVAAEGDSAVTPETALPAPPETASTTPESDPNGSGKLGRRKRRFTGLLPRKQVYLQLREEDISADLRNHPRAKRFYKKIREDVELEPPKLSVVEVYQEVIVVEDDAGQTQMASAPKPLRLIDSFAGPCLLAWLTACRFADHLPYYRLEDILSRCGFRIGRSTQWRWMFALAGAVDPLVARMRSLALESLVLGVDETPVRLLNQPGSQKSYLWGVVGDRGHPYDCFYFTADRARAGPEAFLAGFEGYLQSDAYVCYERIALDCAQILKVACWAHARRKFEELHFTGATPRTHAALRFFQQLYDIEDRGRELTDEARLALRQRESRPLVAEFRDWLEAQHLCERPKSKLRGAIAYMLNRWASFERYLEHGAIPIDNNRTEASLKYAILGRKAWLFFGNEQGGAAAASLFTLTKSCNRHAIDPHAYLRNLYERLPGLAADELDGFLPDRWIVDHPEHRLQERVVESQARARRTRARRALRRQGCSQN